MISDENMLLYSFNMVESNTSSNLFNLSCSTVNALKKADLVQQIVSLRRKAIINSDLPNLYDQISNSC